MTTEAKFDKKKQEKIRGKKEMMECEKKMRRKVMEKEKKRWSEAMRRNKKKNWEKKRTVNRTENTPRVPDRRDERANDEIDLLRGRNRVDRNIKKK